MFAGNAARVRHDWEIRPGMSLSARQERFDEDSMWVTLDDGRVLGEPLAWFPRLMAAPPAEREAVVIGAFGLH